MSGRVTIVIGAGPAGLTAAYVLAREGERVAVVEADPERVGGISRTVEYRGYLFDIGGHRFFSKSAEIDRLWSEMLPEEHWKTCERRSRIFYRGRFFSYPLKAGEAFRKLGVWESARCLASYVKARCRPKRNPATFEEWVSNRFGRRLYTIFFKTYTEKVWGIPCDEISADWAAQRIKDLNLTAAVLSAFGRRAPKKGGKEAIKTLITTFRYPRRGPGMLWSQCADRIRERGGEILMGQRVTGCAYDAEREAWRVLCVDAAGQKTELKGTHVISSAPLRTLAGMIQPEVSAAAREAAERLRYRDFIVVAVMLKNAKPLQDHWIYIHDPSVRVGRIQNFRAWSEEMVPDPVMVCYGMEYFCFADQGDLWSMPDERLGELAAEELVKLGLADAGDITDTCVVRQRKAYPVYDDAYAKNVEVIREELESRFPTLHLIGRNGMHKYNNQDHSMMTGILSARNILAGERRHDPWLVNEDAEYHETTEAGETSTSAISGLRGVPERVRNPSSTPTSGGL